MAEHDANGAADVNIDMNCLMAAVLAVIVPLLPRKASIQFDDPVPF